MKKLLLFLVICFVVSGTAAAATADDGVLSNITDITMLEKTYVTFQIAIPDACGADIAAKLISASGEIPGTIEASGKLLFIGLTPDANYKLIVYNAADNTVIDEIAFKTFNGEGKREFQYFADIRNCDAGIVDVKIFMHYNKEAPLRMKRIPFHTAENIINVVDGVTVNKDPVSVNPEDYSFSAILPANKTAVIEYSSDRSYQNISSHGSQGILTDTYFMATGEQFLLLPDTAYYEKGYLYSFSFITNTGWQSKIGMETTEYANLYVSGSPVFTAVQYFAYNPSYFDVSQKQIFGTTVTAIIENTVTNPYADCLFAVYEAMCELWGGDVSDIPYTLMIVHDSRPVYAGEFDTGQGFSDMWGIGEMLVHQIYHRWQGWDAGMHQDNSIRETGGFWIEGFNEYYCYKLMRNMESLAEAGRGFMLWCVDSYKSGLQSGTDISLLERQTDSAAVYYKGACLAYLLDKEIQARSSGAYSLDDVLKYFYNEFMEKQAAFSYDKMLGYINTLIDGDIYEWWDRYLVNNEPFVIEDFESRSYDATEQPDTEKTNNATTAQPDKEGAGYELTTNEVVLMLIGNITGRSRKLIGETAVNGQTLNVYSIEYMEWIQDFKDILRKDKDAFVYTFLTATSALTEEDISQLDDDQKYAAVETILDYMLVSGFDVQYLIDNLYTPYNNMPCD